MGTVPPSDISTADFTTFNDFFSKVAAGDGLKDPYLDWGTAYLIADAKESRESASSYVSEKIGDYSYKKADHYAEGITSWRQKYNDLLDTQMVSAPSTAAVRSDKDMSALGIDQNTIYGV